VIDQSEGVASLYLELMKQSLTRNLFDDAYQSIQPRRGTIGSFLYAPIRKLLAMAGCEIVRRTPKAARMEGRDLPLEAETMVGLLRLENLSTCIKDVVDNNVPGDLLEAGVWRGGASIFMRAALRAYGAADRRVWVADSFQGLPPPDPKRFPADAEDRLSSRPQLAISLDEVKANFRRYGMLDEGVSFIPGFFQDSLAGAPIARLAVLRIDADMYQSTIEVLQRLYTKVSPGGYVIIDDYGAMASCRAAVDDFRAQNAIDEELVTIDWTGVFWHKTRGEEGLPA
jgi:O-methyltransferase